MSLPKITAGGFSSFSLNSNGEIKGYGPDFFRMITDIPKGFGYKDISTAFYYALAINSNNEIVGWGSMTSHIYHDREREEPIERSEYLKLSSQVGNIPRGNNYIAVAAGSKYSLALTSKGEIVCCGRKHLINMLKLPGS
uniref:Regulator of chromosome condensation protein n=1 Tax=Pithovirus LCPAC401 TaxID=2506595 RepID=A0A481ZAB8_9VIRU|nr:MAG: regulator of chromosome condensation protein [Pithovirus LCPAC401]